MGREAKCRVQVGSTSGIAKVLLETDEIVVRGEATADLKLRMPLRRLNSVSVRGETLVLGRDPSDAAHPEVTLHLGANEAARWAEKITNPPSRSTKLGIAGEASVALVGTFDADFAAELPRTVSASHADVVFVAADDSAELPKIAATATKMKDTSALWVVYPKGRKDIREADVIEAGRAAGLKDVKVARFSETHTALKFVVPVSARAIKTGKKRAHD